MPNKNLDVKIFADGADKVGMLNMSRNPMIKGLTTNPTLMRKAGVKDYSSFAKELLKEIKNLPISFEVFSDEFDEMHSQAIEISSWGSNAYVKVPVTNTKGAPSYNLIRELSNQGVKVNVTAVMTLEQVRETIDMLNPNVPSYISIFAGRIADTGRDPLPVMQDALNIMKKNPSSELIWASTRELYNIIQANQIGCHIITVTNDLINKINLFDHDLNQFSLETVKMFYSDALAAGYKI